jgi:hypothetical protein
LFRSLLTIAAAALEVSLQSASLTGDAAFASAAATRDAAVNSAQAAYDADLLAAPIANQAALDGADNAYRFGKKELAARRRWLLLSTYPLW